jgi:dTDP-4-amino-4,6-dideoxygalactose transaminase
LNIPFLDIKRQHAAIQDELVGRVTACLNGASYIEGPEVKSFESRVADFLGVRHAITCGSGTAALVLALKASGIGAGDEVITTAFSFFASAEAIRLVGATPVFIDVLDDFTIDPEQIAPKLTNKTKAILPVHIFGRPARMDEINAVAKKYDLQVIEDACQAIGATYRGKKCGALGDLAAFSFYPTKNLGGIGDGGMVTTNSDRLAVIVRALKSHAGGKVGLEAAIYLGKSNADDLPETDSADALYDPYKYFNYLVADNSRLDSIQAAALGVKLPLLSSYNARRKAIADRYTQELSTTPLTTPAADDADRVSCWHQYAVLSEDKTGLIDFLCANEIGSGAFYPVPLHLQKAFADLGYHEGDLPVAERICAMSVCLPIFPELSEDEQTYVIDVLKSND